MFVFSWRLFQIVSNTMDLDASWGQGSIRSDFHFVTFRSLVAVQDGLLLSTTFGLVLALLDAVVLEKIQLLHLQKQQRICMQWSIVHCQQFDTFGILWHSLPRVVDSCGHISVHCHPFQCRILVPLLGPLDFTFLTRPPLPHSVHVWGRETVPCPSTVLSRRSELRLGGADAIRNLITVTKYDDPELKL